MLLLSAIREYENDLEQSSREKAEPRTIHYFLAFKRQPLITLKQCMLAVVIARASSASPVLSRSDHTPLIRQMSRQVKELYFPDHTPKMARCIMTRSATWVSRGQFNELGINTRHDCSAHNPQLAIHIAISMPSADLHYMSRKAWSPAFNISSDKDGISAN